MKSLSPASRELASAFINLNREGCRTAVFQNALRKEFAAHGWEPKAIKQVMSEIAEIAERPK